MKHKKVDKQLVQCIVICAFTAIMSFLYFIIKGDGFLTIRDDFNVQQIPFTIATHNALLQGGLGGWCWNLDLGTSIIQGFSFYELGSPFFWISLLFPTSFFPYVVGWLYILKYIVAGTCSYLYIKRFTKRNQFALIGAILYAFSGFQTTNLLFYHFHDVVAFFPLLLLGIEKVMEDHKDKGLFIFAVFINSIINYFFFVQEVVFLGIYFLIRFWDKKPGVLIRRIMTCMVCGIVGVGMSAIIFLPSVMYVQSNPRSSLQLYLQNMVWDSKGFLFVLKGFLLPGEAMHDHSSIIAQQWNSTACYLPMVGLTCVFAYIEKKRDWLSKIMKILLIISFLPILSSGFLLFTAIYQRWWYMLILMMALATSLVVENASQFNIRKSALINMAILLGYYLVIQFMKWSKDSDILVFHKVRLFGYFAVAFAGMAIIYLLARTKKLTCKYMVIGISAFSILTTAVTLHFYRVNTTPTQDYKRTFTLGTKLEKLDDQYRYNTGDNLITLTGEAAGLSSFSSTVANSIWDFDELLDFYAGVIRLDKNSVPGIAQLLGAKYYITQDPGEASPVQEIEAGDTKYFVMETEACPIGYAVHNYILKDDLMAIEKNKRGIALLSSAVIEKDVENIVSKGAKRSTAETTNFNRTIEDYVRENSSGAVKNFSRDTNGFTCTSEYRTDTFVYFSIPYDDGWKAYIDGQKVEIIKSGGMMLIKVPSGEHTIDFAYRTPGFMLGSVISVVCILSYLLYEVYKYRKNAS